MNRFEKSRRANPFRKLKGLKAGEAVKIRPVEVNADQEPADTKVRS